MTEFIEAILAVVGALCLFATVLVVCGVGLLAWAEARAARREEREQRLDWWVRSGCLAEQEAEKIIERGMV